MLVQLQVMRERELSAKARQFASTIEWLKVKLQEQGFGYRTISGSMTLKQRSKVCSDCIAALMPARGRMQEGMGTCVTMGRWRQGDKGRSHWAAWSLRGRHTLRCLLNSHSAA